MRCIMVSVFTTVFNVLLMKNQRCYISLVQNPLFSAAETGFFFFRVMYWLLLLFVGRML